MKKLVLLTTLPAALFFSSCEKDRSCEKGDGPIETAELNIADFHSFSLELPATVFLTQGSEQRVLVEAQSNVINDLEVDVRNGHWEIELDECYRKYKDVVFYITIPEIEKIGVAGSGEVIGENTISEDNVELSIAGSGDIDLSLHVERLETKISGSGDMKLEGSTDFHEAAISGSGDISAYDLESEVTDASIAGSGSCRVHVNDALDVTISGSGDVYYKGDPSVNSVISGSGDIHKID